MLKKLRNLPLSAYLFTKGLISDIKNDERGLSGVVVAILLILVAVLAVVMIWGFLGGWLADLWETIVGEAGNIN
ncbi:MAG: hypothetical protein FWD05_03185 [Oscillospiraceae bacterium]|nr:hypothetical protein [Oscillospiraceae bacterium]